MHPQRVKRRTSCRRRHSCVPRACVSVWRTRYSASGSVRSCSSAGDVSGNAGDEMADCTHLSGSPPLSNFSWHGYFLQSVMNCAFASARLKLCCRAIRWHGHFFPERQGGMFAFARVQCRISCRRRHGPSSKGFPGIQIRRLFPHIWQSLVSPIRVLNIGVSFARFSVACDTKNKFPVTFVIRVFLLLLPYSPHRLIASRFYHYLHIVSDRG